MDNLSLLEISSNYIEMLFMHSQKSICKDYTNVWNPAFSKNKLNYTKIQLSDGIYKKNHPVSVLTG